MTCFIFARDGTSRIVLKRESRDAAEKKARELTDLGWFEVRILEEVQVDESGMPGEVASSDPGLLRVWRTGQRQA